MNTGPSARQHLTAKYEQLEELLNSGGGGGGDVLPEAALVFVSAESCSKLTAASYDRSKAAKVAELSFDEETQALLEQLSKHQGACCHACVFVDTAHRCVIADCFACFVSQRASWSLV